MTFLSSFQLSAIVFCCTILSPDVSVGALSYATSDTSLDKQQHLYISQQFKFNTLTRVSLNDELMREIILEFSNYNFSKLVDEKDIALSFVTTENISLCTHDTNIEENIIQQMTKMENPFLIKALEKYLPFNMVQKDKINGLISNKFSNAQLEHDIYYKLKKMSEFVLPCGKVLKNTLSRILILRYSGTSKLVKDIMLKEHKLDVHLKIVRSVYMMEMGHVMNKFCKIIFTEIETNATWNNSNFLTSILEEILSQEWSESNSRWSIITDPVLTYQVLRAIDGITLHYAIDWPVSMFLNEETLKMYNELFQFQLKLKWALWTLENLKFSDLEGSKLTNIINKVDNFYAKRLQCLRFWLIHAIGSVHSYVTGQVLQGLGFVLEKTLNEVNDLDTIIAVHNKYLQKMRVHCFLTLEFRDLMVTINNLFYMCVHVQNKWKSDASATFTNLKELDLMESAYVNYHTHFALALHNAVQHKDADYCEYTML
ncbi:gamma-tubulin complex component 5 isoform X2 [Cephus cinctus]|uniref:Gamma-tubulin complex component n=1 Tax=Cephus cinctus TaxID=211228 RepID=A0AAJ7W2D1_CEPCN|nr:gamma-tubulin complex component 5 isoform X2 [Cephus cinctus]